MLPTPEVGEWSAAEPIKEDKLAALDVVPLCIKIVSYAQPPKHIWANRTYLQLTGQTLEAFRAQDASAPSDSCSKVFAARYQHCQVEKKKLMEPADFSADDKPRERDNGVENMCVPVSLQYRTGEVEEGVMITKWPAEVKRNLEGSNKYMKKLLECSPYPLCLFNFNGHLITCNPAAVAVFGNTIWLQSDIFGMSERERCGLDPDQLKNHSASFTIERTERCTAYEAMMEALVEDGSSYQTDLMIRRRGGSGAEEFWYCRVFAQRHKDPITGEPLIMISHQDVTELRKVEGELGRMEMSANTKHDLMKHDSDVAGSLMVLLGEDWNFADDKSSGGEGVVSTDGKSETLTPRSMESTVSADSVNMGQRPAQLHGLRACLDKADEWEFNVFDLEKESDGLPLQVLCWHLFMKHNLIEEFQLDQIKLINFLRTIENGHQDNPYHNATHVADVMQSMHCLLIKGGIGKFVGKLEKFAGLFSAIVHDFEHRGFNNDFLIKTVDEWAINSNDKSPNESHHLSAAFRILRQPECDFMHRMNPEMKSKFRKMVIDMVMATDMGEHMAIVSKLKTEIQKRIENPDDEIGDDPPESLRILVMQGAIKVADIGHLYAELSVHIEWSERLEEEMWRQGDVEKERNMKVSFLMDRQKPGVTKSQPGFIDFVVRPLFETWVSCFPESNVLLDRINQNYAVWQTKEKSPRVDDAAK